MKIEKISDIPGWFDFHDVYQNAVARFPSGTFVELGSYYGQSTAYLAEQIRISMNKVRRSNIVFYAVDLWKKDPRNDHNSHLLSEDIFPDFVSHLQQLHLEHLVIPVQQSTTEAARIFREKKITFDFIFIDANHTFEAVRDDINNYLPLLNDGGIIAGHDIYMSGVRKAVDLAFGNRWTFNNSGSSWIHHKK